jgi:hypothetical protein
MGWVRAFVAAVYASSSEAIAPWGVPTSADTSFASAINRCFQPLEAKAAYTTVTDAMLDKRHQPLMTDCIEESRHIRATIQFTFVRLIATARASSASC